MDVWCDDMDLLEGSDWSFEDFKRKASINLRVAGDLRWKMIFLLYNAYLDILTVTHLFL